MDLYRFLIDQHDFYAPLNPIQHQNSFVVQSVPRPYQVIYDDTIDPMLSVNQVLKSNPNNLLFIDQKVFDLYGKTLCHPEKKILKAIASENFKTLDGMLELLDFMSQNQITKGEKVVVVGGGIIQDVGAFSNAIYKRGIPWVFFPTTLLSQCDSCIGGKCGLNYQGAKNNLALFSAPSQVVVCPEFLKTLSTADIKSGLGEILKLHIEAGIEFLNHYIKYKPSHSGLLSVENAKALTLSALSVKKAVIEKDEFESNYRRSLNYGHTLGHAIEILSKYQIPHGQAITIGLLIKNEMSFRRGFLPELQKEQIKRLAFEIIDPLSIQVMHNLQLAELAQLLKKDKKTLGSIINFVMLYQIGDVKILSIELNEQLLSEITEIIKELFY